MKKAWKCCSVLILALVLFLASGCNPNYRPEFEYGDFICREWIEGKIYITDLSEQGKQKRVLIVPEEVNGKPVVTIRNPAKWGGTEWKSEGLEKVYLPWDLNVDLPTFRLYFNLSIFIIEFREPVFFLAECHPTLVIVCTFCEVFPAGIYTLPLCDSV